MRKYFALSILVAAAALADSPTCPPNYSYNGFTQPLQWQYVSGWHCNSGQQSPINIAGQFGQERNKPISVAYQTAAPVFVRNSGHDFRVIPKFPQNNRISVAGIGPVTLDNVHFHLPAEHAILAQPGQPRLDGEIHFVHTDNSNPPRIFVIAVLLSKTGNNTALQPIIDQLPINLCAQKETTINLAALLPQLPQRITTYYRYIGSLTTPKCDGNVTFFVVPEVKPIGPLQHTRLHAFGDNSRPLQNRMSGTTITRVTP